MRLRLFVVLAAAILGAGVAHAHKQTAKSTSSHSHHGPHAQAKGTAGEYDYYVMSLSWSPTFCRTHPDEQEQCASKGYGFVLHGLWPQYERGGGPENCSTQAGPDRKTIARTLAFMPSRSLINHEWRAHGACTGLDPAAYFGLADRAFAAVQVPQELAAPNATVETTSDDLIAAFRRANGKLDDTMLTLHCSRGELVEVRVCLDKNLDPRACGKRMQSRCPARATFELPASR